MRKSLNTLANDEGEEISQFFQANLDAGIIDEDMLHIFDDYINGEENAMGKDTSDKGEEPSDKGKEPLPQFYQAMIDAGVITADDLREWNSYLEDEKGEENTTDVDGDDGEIENLINTQTLEKDAEAATEAEDKLMKIIDLLGEEEQKQVKTYLTKHQTDKEFLLGLLGKHPKLLFSEV